MSEYNEENNCRACGESMGSLHDPWCLINSDNLPGFDGDPGPKAQRKRDKRLKHPKRVAVERISEDTRLYWLTARAERAECHLTFRNHGQRSAVALAEVTGTAYCAPCIDAINAHLASDGYYVEWIPIGEAGRFLKEGADRENLLLRPIMVRRNTWFTVPPGDVYGPMHQGPVIICEVNTSGSPEMFAVFCRPEFDGWKLKGVHRTRAEYLNLKVDKDDSPVKRIGWDLDSWLESLCNAAKAGR